MSKLVSIVKALRKDESGVTMIEYTILLGIITVAVIVTIGLVGTWVSEQWVDLEAALT